MTYIPWEGGHPLVSAPTPWGIVVGDGSSGPVISQHCLLQLDAASSVALSEVSAVPPPVSAAVSGVGWLERGLFLHLWP